MKLARSKARLSPETRYWLSQLPPTSVEIFVTLGCAVIMILVAIVLIEYGIIS